MDDTHQSRTRASDAAAAATRKRRSSILKSQKLPRTPFSDVEFNVATPTDTTKSRRVSFSKRTDVAEFATNEATNTWKNFYEEHNKSLDLSGNEFGVNASKQPIGHIGKRIFDQQFELEAIDINILNPCERIINTSMNNVNFTQQTALLECTEEDRKLTAPQSKFELNTFTDHQSIVFGNDLAIHSMGETIDHINVNFSDVQDIGSNDNDDLDELQKDLERARSNAAYHRPPSNEKDISEYIELNFDTTNIAMRCEDSDMSISETIRSPKIQDVYKNFSIDKKFNGSTSKDWITDKENIAINPYVAPQESANFAVNEEPDKVLVFDGKRLIIQSEKKNTQPNIQSQTNLPDTSYEKNPQRKTIILNMNDDLPNYVNTSSGTSIGKPRQSKMIFNDGELLIDKVEQNASHTRTIVYDNDIGDVSMTQAIPNIIIIPQISKVNIEKRRTILFDNDTANISVTQALPNLILPGNSEEVPDKKKIIDDVNETSNISITQAVSTNILCDLVKEIPKRRKTILYENDDGDVSITQSVPSHMNAADNAQNPEKRRTIVFENDMENISVTQAIPTKILLSTNTYGNLDNVENAPGKRQTIIFDDDLGDISLTQAVPQHILLDKIETGRRTTIVYETDNDVSITQTVPTKFTILNNRDSNKTVFDNDAGDISVTQAIPTNILLSLNPEAPQKSKSFIFEDNTANLSIIQAVPNNQVIPGVTHTCIQSTDICYENDLSIAQLQKTADTNKIKTIVYENDEADISMTQAIPANIIFDDAKTNDKCRTIVYEDNTADISITQNVPTIVLELDGITKNTDSSEKKAEISEIVSQEPKRQTIVFQDEDVSMTEIISKKVTTHKRKSVSFNEISMIEALPLNEVPGKKKTIVFDSDKSNLSMTNVPSIQTSPQNEDFDTSNVNKNAQETNNMTLDFIIYQTDTTHNVHKWQSKTNPSNTKTQYSINKNKKQSTHEDEKVVESSLSEESVTTYTSGEMQLVRRDPDKPEETESEVSVEPKKSIIFMHELESPSNQVVKADSQTTKSILNELLDMSTGSHDGLGEKNIVNPSVENEAKDTDNTAKNESIFNEKRESDEDCQTDESVDSENDGRKTTKRKGNKSGIVDELKNKLVKLKSSISGSKYNFPKNRHYEKIISSDLLGKRRKNKKANDTNELLDMLSELTDTSAHDKVNEENPIVHITVNEHKTLENENPAKKITVKEYKALENKNLLESLEEHNALQNEKDADSITVKEHNIAYNNDKQLKPLTMKELPAAVDEKPVNPVSVKVSTTFESKNTIIEPKRLSFATSRHSIALSREELINNISMAQAALQLSREDMDESENTEDTENDMSFEQYVPHKSNRMSSEVVKTLNFEEDETASEISMKDEMKASPIKKTTFGDTSFIKDKNAKVIPIPNYLEDVSNGIKELMDDLVKPMADVLPFDLVGIDKSVNKISSTCSTQIQANLVTSSQIDVCGELMSDSAINMKQLDSLASGIALLGNEAVARALKSPIQCVSPEALVKSSEFEVSRQSHHVEKINRQTRSPRFEKSPPKSVIVFDHNNPLNNVLLGSIDYSKVHKYHPGISSESLSSPARYDSSIISVNEDEKVNDTERISHHYNVESRLSMKHSVQQAGDASSEKAADVQSILSNESKAISVDQATDAQVVDIRDTEVNTIIAMKGNNELLDASSSLTLVDDALARSSFDININSPTISSHEDHSSKGHISSVKVIYKTEDQVEVSSEKQGYDFTSDDNLKSHKNCSKSKKKHSPVKREKQKKLTFDLTPQHMSKMQKLSNSPKRPISPEKIQCLPAERDETDLDTCTIDTDDMQVNPENKKKINKQKPPRKVKNSMKGRKGKTLTVQHLIAEHNIETVNKQILQAVKDPKSGCSSVEPNALSQSDEECKSLEVVSSCASSKNEMHTSPSLTRSESLASSVLTNQMLNLRCRPLINETISTNTIDECESCVNVVAKINMLSFMGSQDCEWEATSGDTWTFLLLSGRLRLSVRLAHRHDNDTRTRVRADTAVLDVTLETVPREKQLNIVAATCVRFAHDAMRFYMGLHRCRVAGDVPLLVRRCAGVARVALRWGRAMMDARLQLAYTLTPTGHLTLKVANIPLRSMWEVSMKLELLLEEASGYPWPRAGHVRVSRVAAGEDVSPEHVDRLLAHMPRDWGHVPHTVWKIFRYLKHKRRDDSTLLGF